MLKKLVKLASELDKAGRISDANKVDFLIKRYAQSVPDSQSPQATSAPAISKFEERYQLQEKEGRYVLILKTPNNTSFIGQFKLNEFPSVIKEVISGKRPVEGATPEEKYTVDQFIITPYGIVNGAPKPLQRERVIESSLTKDILGSLKNLPTAPPPKILSPDEQILDSSYASYKNQFKSCVVTQINSEPGFKVITDITITVAKDGTLSDFKAISTPPNPAFDACLAQKIRTWKFRELSAPTTRSFKQRFGREN